MFFLAILPGIALFVVVWRSDKIEKEPPKLLWKLFLFGMLTTISTYIIGTAGDKVISFLDPSSIIYMILENFIMVALVEEGGKFFVLKKLTWKHPAFDYTFDAVVYAVTASLGFAVLENVLYVLDGDMATAIMRALLSVPGHVIYAIYMGYYYGMAKVEDTKGNGNIVKKYLIRALAIPTLLHGFYDFCLDTEYDILLLAVAVFEIVLTVKGVKKLRLLSRDDVAIMPVDEPDEITYMVAEESDT